MAIPTSEEYKAKLRQCNVSHTSPHDPGYTQFADPNLSETDKDLDNPSTPGSNTIITTDISNPEAQSGDSSVPAVVKELAIISMSDFEVVNMDDKLNLLMSAINKINTTFHHKFESLNKKVFRSRWSNM